MLEFLLIWFDYVKALFKMMCVVVLIIVSIFVFIFPLSRPEWEAIFLYIPITLIFVPLWLTLFRDYDLAKIFTLP